MAEPLSQEEAIFYAALEIDAADQRAAYLDQACGEQGELRRRVEVLLRREAQSAGPLDRPVGGPGATTAELPAERPGAMIGPYKLIQRIGEGGMGTVWMAQQTEPVRRLVAVKLIKDGMDSRQVIARFEAERQALALMDHANIARVLDGGTTGVGRPYFVMDLVKGVPITRFCDEHRLTPRQRLELFLPVCQAVQHAHHKGIIHRDLKPSNVLVALYDGQPVPKVIDFGVAKAAGPSLTDKTLVTGFGHIVGTLEYMSPEQAEINQLDIDTRSDIYSLGVLLYELLTGSTPFTKKDFEKAGMLEMLRVIREQEPSKPSTKLSTAEGLPTLAANRGTDPAKLTKLVRGELDWIVMKALEKDRNRRYETANGFALDVQRYLADEPVLACPPSAGYRLRKFARRNKAALVMTSVIGVALLLAVGSLGWAIRDREAGRVRTAGEVNQFLQRAESLYAANKLPEAVAEVQKARGVLEAGSSDADLGRRVSRWLTDLDTATKLEAIRLESATDRDRRYTDYARVFRDYGIDVEALPAEEAAAQIAASPIKIDLALALGAWASMLRFDPRPQEPARWQRLMAISRAAHPDPWRLRLLDAAKAKDIQALRDLANGADPDRLSTRTLGYLGESLRTAGDAEAAVAFLHKAQKQHPGDFSINLALSLSLRDLKPPPWDEVIAFQRAALAVRPQDARVHSNLGGCLTQQKKLDEAIAYLHKAIELNPKYAPAHNNLGNALKSQGKLPEAIVAYRKAIKLDPTARANHYNLGIALADQKKLPEAIAAFNKAIEIDANYAPAYIGLGNALRDQKKLDKAIAAYNQAIEIDPNFAPAYHGLGNALYDQKKLPEAIAAYNTAIKIDPNCAPAYNDLGRALYTQKKLPEAIAAYNNAIQIDRNYAPAYNGLGAALREQNKLPEAIAAFNKAIEIDANYAPAYIGLGNALLDQKKVPEAIAAYNTAIKIDPNCAPAYNNLGSALCVQKKFPEAIVAFRKAIEINPEEATYLRNLAAAHFQLGEILHSRGNLDDAIAEFRQALTLEKKKAAVSPQDTGLPFVQFRLASLLNDRAWQLVAGADAKSRDPKRAIELAQEAAALSPGIPTYRTTLGAAHYRAGNWKAAVETLEKSRARSPADSVILFFLSMAHGRLNEKGKACTFYDQAARWRMGIGSTDEELRRLCAEAAALLGREVPPPLKEPPVLTPGPTLIKPAAGATLDNGSIDFSKLMVWEFDWSDVPGATQYHLYVIAPTAKLPSTNNPTLTSSSYRNESKGSVADHVRLGWRWKVRALVKGTWTDWSEERTFDVAPLDDSKPPSPKK